MRQIEDTKTGDLLGDLKRSVGRPLSGCALSSSQRQKLRRERLRASGVGSLTVELPLDVLDALTEFVRFKDIKRDDVILRLLRQQLLRKR